MNVRTGTRIALALLLGAAAPAAAQTVAPPEPPPAVMLRLQDQLQSDAWLGFTYRTQVVSTNGSHETRMVVRDVRPDSPAGRAGLASGDEMLRVNGIAATPELMRSVSRALEVGDTVRLRVRRDAAERQVTLVAERRPEDARSADDLIIDSEGIRRRVRVLLDSALVHLDTLELPRFRIERRDGGVELHIQEGGFPLRAGRMRVDADSVTIDADGREIRIFRLPDARGLRMHLDTLGTFEAGPGMFFMRRGIVGAELTELSPELARHFPGAGEGLLVLRVGEGTPAARAGLQPGDVIAGAGGNAVTRLRDLQRAVASSPAEPITLEVVRDGRRRELRLPARSSTSR